MDPNGVRDREIWSSAWTQNSFLFPGNPREIMGKCIFGPLERYISRISRWISEFQVLDGVYDRNLAICQTFVSLPTLPPEPGPKNRQKRLHFFGILLLALLMSDSQTQAAKRFLVISSCRICIVFLFTKSSLHTNKLFSNVNFRPTFSWIAPELQPIIMNLLLEHIVYCISQVLQGSHHRGSSNP